MFLINKINIDEYEYNRQFFRFSSKIFSRIHHEVLSQETLRFVIVIVSAKV